MSGSCGWSLTFRCEKRSARRPSRKATRGVCSWTRGNQLAGSVGRASLAEKPGRKGRGKLGGSRRWQVHLGMTEQHVALAMRASRKRKTKRDRPKPPLYRLDTLCGKAPKVRRFCQPKNVGKGKSHSPGSVKPSRPCISLLWDGALCWHRLKSLDPGLTLVRSSRPGYEFCLGLGLLFLKCSGKFLL